MTVRLSVNVNDETAATLKELARAREMTVTEVIRRAVSAYKFLDEELVDSNKIMRLVDKRTKKETDVALLR